MDVNAIEEAVVAKLRELPEDQQQEVLAFVSALVPPVKRPRKSLYGICAGQGLDFSEAEIAEARKEMWGNFPREQFFK